MFALDEPVSGAVMTEHHDITPVIDRAQRENHLAGIAALDFGDERLEQLPRQARHVVRSQWPVGSVRRLSALLAKYPFENFIRSDLFGRGDRERILQPHL